MKARFANALAGGLMGFGQGKLQQIEKEEAELKSQRALAAQMAMQERVAKIKAEYAGQKDERDHEQARELKGMEVDAADKRAATTAAAADKRTAETNASRERAAKIRADAPPRASQAKPSFRTAKLPDGSGWGYVDPATGEFSKTAEGKFIEASPPYRDRQPSGGSTKPPPTTPPPKPDPNAPPMAGAKKAPDGLWYVQVNGQWNRVGD